MVQEVKLTQNAGLTDAERAFAILDEFCSQNGGNAADILVDSKTNVARVVTFQTAKMKRLFKAFPEVVLVDSTHNTNANRYKLFSFMVHDVFGKGQYIHHALVESEHKVNLRRVIDIFKQNNPEWRNIQVFVTDKAVHEKDVLREGFPDARQLLCQWHVATWLKKQAARLAGPVKKEVKGLLALMVYAKNVNEYENAKGAMLEKLSGNDSHPLYKTFVDNWDNTQDEWVSYKRGNVPHLTNNTNNRIESKWGKIKDVIKDTFSIDQLVSTLITLQEYAEDQYITEYHRVGGRPSGLCEDVEISSLALQISKFALNLVSEQYKLATGPSADYKVQLSSGKATVTSQMTGNTYEVNTFFGQILVGCENLVRLLTRL
ncbi:Hypothetical protein PHPALM_19375 [Phytophthora palmivora]|uniref:ZSWIM1/3 RNaseH-like domain-containing protein n=1 Tax=Phytophthora palmivora TaxID=4796 RepID=A0A2P4XHI9_9STRA|nr:Hypothetical protein PHPALM_19375 [Phytophthora palmivora]